MQERTLFNMNNSTKKWLFMKYSSVILLPLMLWFIINFVSIYDSDYVVIVDFFSKQSAKIFFSLFLIFFFFFSALTVSEIFEDYINNEKTKNVANKVTYIFAIVVPLITILGIFKLSI
mgnify:FL=1|jgi:succinate dehydrogenase / fumarate reductase membrane anchor subunit